MADPAQAPVLAPPEIGEDGISRTPLFYAGKVRMVPTDRAQEAIDAGYSPTSVKDVERYDAAKRYKETTSQTQRNISAVALGATTTIAGVPALLTQILPGVDIESGGSLMAKLASPLVGGSPEEVEEAMRVMMQDAPDYTFAGQLGGSLLGAKGLGAGAASAGKALSIGAKGSKLATAGYVGESAYSQVVFSQEQAFIEKRELTGEMMALSAFGGAAGPLAFNLVGKGLGAATKKTAGAIDARRLASFQKTMPHAKGKAPHIGPAPPATGKPPTKFSDLLGTPAQRGEAGAGLLDELATASASAGKFAERLATGAAKFGARRVSGAGRRAVGMGGNLSSLPGFGMMLGGFMFDHVAGAAMGGIAGKLIQRWGPKVSGKAFNNAADKIRAMSASAAKNVGKGPSTGAKAIKGGFDILSRAQYRGRLNEILQSTDAYSQEVLGNPNQFIADVGDLYGEIGEADPGIVPQVTKQHMITAQYMIENKPGTQPLSPLQPNAGRTEPPIEEMEAYARKVRAVQNPLVVLHDLQMGTLKPDTIDAVRAVYPAMYLDMQTEVLKELSNSEEKLTRKQQMTLDIFFGNQGLVYAQYSPQFLARIATLNKEHNEKQAQQTNSVSRQGQGGGSNPSMAQSMRTTSQRLANNGSA